MAIAVRSRAWGTANSRRACHESLASRVAPIDLVTNRVRVDDGAGTARIARPQQHAIADNRKPRIASQSLIADRLLIDA